MTNSIENQLENSPKKGFSGMQVFLMVVGAMCIAIVATAFAIKIFLFPGPFKPVTLSAKEEQQLTLKLEQFDSLGEPSSAGAKPHKQQQEVEDGSLVPEKYTEEGASRVLKFTERELNSMVAKNTDLAEKLAIDLAQDMVSIKLLLPMDPDFPVLGGKTLKLKAGAELAFRDGRPVVKLRGVSVMGVPMPNAWLGGLKNIDLVREFGADEGFWRSFADGVESVSVVEGFLEISLKE